MDLGDAASASATRPQSEASRQFDHTNFPGRHIGTSVFGRSCAEVEKNKHHATHFDKTTETLSYIFRQTSGVLIYGQRY